MTDYRHDIEKYLKGELTPSERNALERKALYDPFLADALEGAEQIKAGEFSVDVAGLNERIAVKKTVSVWMWTARIAAGLAIILVSTFIVWSVMKTEPSPDLAFEKSEPVATPSETDSATTILGEPSSSPAETATTSEPTSRDNDVVSRSASAPKELTKPLQQPSIAKTETEIKNEPVADALIAETKAEVAKEDIVVTEPVAVAKQTEKEGEVSRAKAFDDTQERKVAKKKDAILAGADKSAAGVSTPTVIQKKVTYPIGQIKTAMGEILFWLYDETPKHKASFIKLANANYWDTLTFNRIINNFVIQGGCPDTPEGFADSPYLIKPEFNDSIRHVYGAVGAGRDDNSEKLSAGCQLYIVQNKKGLARLDGNYMIFGKVFKGMDVVDAIASVKTDSTDTPLKPIRLDVNVINLTADELRKMGFDVK
jgi:peptidyl-prolyl cis-trans isomerase B (cyclophilin B)